MGGKYTLVAFLLEQYELKRERKFILVLILEVLYHSLSEPGKKFEKKNCFCFSVKKGNFPHRF